MSEKIHLKENKIKIYVYKKMLNHATLLKYPYEEHVPLDLCFIPLAVTGLLAAIRTSHKSSIFH